MEDGSIWGPIILQLVLISINAVFASAEIAVISMNDNRMAKMAAEGDKRAIKLSKLTLQPSYFLSVIQVGITLAGFFGSAFAADNFASRLTSLLIKTGLDFPAATFKYNFGYSDNIDTFLLYSCIRRACSKKSRYEKC